MIKKIRSSKAFTLIEMLIVVAIIGILVGVGVPALRDARADAQLKKRESVIANLATAKSRFELDSTIGEITTFNGAADSSDASGSKFDLLKGYLVVNGTQPADIQALIKGTGYSGDGNLVIGNCAVYNAETGALDTPAVSPAFTGNLD